jgi:hypothetical protein
MKYAPVPPNPSQFAADIVESANQDDYDRQREHGAPRP